MDLHKCDMCGLYLIADGEACHECVNRSMIIRKAAAISQIGVDYGRNEIECNDRGYEDNCELRCL